MKSKVTGALLAAGITLAIPGTTAVSASAFARTCGSESVKGVIGRACGGGAARAGMAAGLVNTLRQVGPATGERSAQPAPPSTRPSAGQARNKGIPADTAGHVVR